MKLILKSNQLSDDTFNKYIREDYGKVVVHVSNNSPEYYTILKHNTESRYELNSIVSFKNLIKEVKFYATLYDHSVYLDNINNLVNKYWSIYPDREWVLQEAHTLIDSLEKLPNVSVIAFCTNYSNKSEVNKIVYDTISTLVDKSISVQYCLSCFHLFYARQSYALP